MYNKGQWSCNLHSHLYSQQHVYMKKTNSVLMTARYVLDLEFVIFSENNGLFANTPEFLCWAEWFFHHFSPSSWLFFPAQLFSCWVQKFFAPIPEVFSSSAQISYKIFRSIISYNTFISWICWLNYHICSRNFRVFCTP